MGLKYKCFSTSRCTYSHKHLSPTIVNGFTMQVPNYCCHAPYIVLQSPISIPHLTSLLELTA